MEKEMAAKQPRRIAITGPESTGKTLLCKQLAEYFNEPWVPEYSREYLNNLGRDYNYDDILEIAKGQFDRENALLPTAKKYLFCDTDFLVTHIWSMVKYEQSHQWIIDMATTQMYDYTLLCNIDLPWEADPLREHPDKRGQLFKFYLKELSSKGITFSVVKGIGSERFRYAVELLALQGIKKSR